MDRGNYEDNISVSIVTDTPQLTVQDAPTNTKVSIWGYELCNGAQWKDFLEVVNKLGKENEQLKQQLEEKDKEIEQYKSNQKVISLHSAEDWYNRFIDTTTQNIKLELNQKQLAIHELEKVKEDCFNQKELVDFGNVAWFMVDIADILEIINNQIKELKGE